MGIRLIRPLLAIALAVFSMDAATALADVVAPDHVTAKLISTSNGVVFDLRYVTYSSSGAAINNDTRAYGGMLGWDLSANSSTSVIEGDFGSPKILTGAAVYGSNSSRFTSFCIELGEQVLTNNVYTLNKVAVEAAPNPGIGAGASSGAASNGNMGAAKADLLRELYGNYYGQLATSPVAGLVNPANYLTVNAAAFQLAIWEIVFDTGNNLYSGEFLLRNTSKNDESFQKKARTLASDWLDKIYQPGILNGKSEKNLMAISRQKSAGESNANRVQDQIVLFEEPVVVPEPASWLCFMGFGVMALARGRKRKSIGHSQER